MEIKEWCAPSIHGTIVNTLDSEEAGCSGFIIIKCNSCEKLHRVFIVGNGFKSRNTMATKKEKVPAEPVEWVDGHGRPTAPPEYVS